MSIDFTKLSGVAAKEATERDQRVYKRIAKITNSAGGRLHMDENDTVVEAIEVLLGNKAGGTEKAMEILGVSSSSAAEPEQPALPAAPEKHLPVFNSDGSPTGTGMLRDDAVKLGYLVKFDGTGGQEGWIIPAIPGSPAPAPAPAASAGDQKVPVVDKKGTEIRLVKVKDGNADPNLEAILNDDNTAVDHFLQKPKVVVRRR
jgi:hypothetical protein